MKLRAMLLLSFFLPGLSVGRADDAQFWQWVTLDLAESERARLFLYADNRIGDGLSSDYLQIVAPRLTWHLHEHLDLGLGYAWLNIDPLGGGAPYWQHRAEFEVNPKWKWGEFSLHSRNRLELRWNDGRGEPRPRLRNRLQVKHPVGDGDGLLRYLYANDETFVDLSRGELVENRFVPLGVGLHLSEHVTLNLFYMVQSVKSGADWEHGHVAGTFFQLGF